MPALPIAVGLVGGIAVEYLLPEAAVTWCVVGSAFAAGIWLWIKSRHWAGCAFVFFAFGLIFALLRAPEPLPAKLTDAKGTITAKVIRTDEAEGSASYLVDIESFANDTIACTGLKFRGLLHVFSAEKLYQPGDVVRVEATLQALGSYNDVPDQVDYGWSARSDGVSVNINASPGQVTLIASQPSAWQRLRNDGSAWLRHAIVTSGFNAKTSEFLLAVIAGDDMLMPRAERDQLRAAGLAHVLALSGLHVGIIAWIASMALFGFRCLPAGRYVYYGLMAVVIFCYAIVTGMTPSVARASMMLGVFFMARVMQRAPTPYNSLCVTVALWLCVNPLWLFAPGMQLSVVAVLAILWIEPRINRIDRRRGWLRAAVSLVVVPFAAMVGTSMLTVCYFHMLPLWFLPTNLVAGLLVPVIVGGGFVAVVVNAIGLPVIWLTGLVDVFYGWLLNVSAFFAGLPHAFIGPYYAHGWQVALYLGCIVAVCAAIETHRRVYYALAGCGTSFLAASFALASPLPVNEFYLPRLGSATTMLMRHGDKAVLITDGGTEAVKRAQALYEPWLFRRHCADFKVINCDDFDLGPFARRGPYIVIGDKTVMIADTLVSCQLQHVDYLVLTGRFKNDAVQQAQVVKPKEVVLSHAINAKRRRRYAAELQQAGYAVSERIALTP